MAKKLTIKELKKICDEIGKKGKDGEPIAEAEIKKWPSVIMQEMADDEVGALADIPQGHGLYLRTEYDGSSTMALGFVLLSREGIRQVEQAGKLVTDGDCRYERYLLVEAIADLPYYWQSM